MSGARPMSMSEASVYSDEALPANQQSTAGPDLVLAAALGGAYTSRNDSASSHEHLHIYRHGPLSNAMNSFPSMLSIVWEGPWKSSGPGFMVR